MRVSLARETVPGLVARGYFFRIERDVYAFQAVHELVRPAGSHDGGGDAGLCEDPGERDVRQALAAFGEELVQRGDLLEYGVLPVALAIELAGMIQRESCPLLRRLFRLLLDLPAR